MAVGPASVVHRSGRTTWGVIEVALAGRHDGKNISGRGASIRPGRPRSQSGPSPLAPLLLELVGVGLKVGEVDKAGGEVLAF